jgi:hypothetical protein
MFHSLSGRVPSGLHSVPYGDGCCDYGYGYGCGNGIEGWSCLRQNQSDRRRRWRWARHYDREDDQSGFRVG